MRSKGQSPGAISTRTRRSILRSSTRTSSSSTMRTATASERTSRPSSKRTAPAAPISSLYDAFSTRYKAEYFNRTPVLYASHSYDAVYLIALAAQKAGAVDGASIKAHLREVSGPSGTVINGGDWSKAVTTIASGGAINWEGAAGSENLNTTNDPGVGSYEIWGVNSSFGITRRAFYTEALVGSL